MAKKVTTVKEVKKTSTGVTSIGSTAKKKDFVTVTEQKQYWKPENEGDSIEGEFIEIMIKSGGQYGTINKETGKKEQEQPFLNVEVDGKIFQYGLPSTKILIDFFKECRKGRYVRITYLGKKFSANEKVKKGQEPKGYHNYLIEAEMEEPKTKIKK